MTGRRIRRLLVANRGEIARRVFRSARGMGIETVAVYSEPDQRAPHVRGADVAVPLRGSTAAESYLDVEKLLDAARRAHADAVHPGYGFLAESAEFAQACLDAGLVWVGPSPGAISSMALKVEAKRIVGDSGVPLLAGALVTGDDPDDWRRAAETVGFPLIVKASAGGGGKGMRQVDSHLELADAVQAGRREAASAFGDPTVFLERLLVRPRHVEVQIFGDEHGNVVHLFERDCSLQRRHQKVLEEARAPGLTNALARSLHEAAVRAASAIGYVNAGTVEFLVAGTEFFFLEMNTRLQVEHPVTEEICGIDLVRLQLQVAMGESLGFTQTEISATGHAIEARLYAEDPTRDFLPSVGTLHRFEHGEFPSVRWDSGVVTGSEVSPFYDPMLAKVIAHAPTREIAADRLAGALRELEVHGVVTNRDALVATLQHEAFLAGEVDTGFFDTHPELLTSRPDRSIRRLHAVAAALVSQQRRRETSAHSALAPPDWRNVASAAGVDIFRVETGEAQPEELQVAVTHGSRQGEDVAVLIDGELVDCALLDVDEHRVDLEFDGLRSVCSVWSVDERHWVNGAGWQSELLELPRFASHDAAAAGRGPTAPLPGTVIVVEVEPGEHVIAGQVLVVIEAMKMEHRILADADGTVINVCVAAGDRVDAHQLLVEIETGDHVEGQP